MQDMKIYALKGDPAWVSAVIASLQNGVGRFGWSYAENADLRILKCNIEDEGWDSLDSDEKDCFQSFLLNLACGDWVVYVNVPEWGKCTLAQVTKPYFWERTDTDFNHRFGVDPDTVRVFDRNDAIVEPALAQKLRLRGRFWRIYAEPEFRNLLVNLVAGSPVIPRTTETGITLLKRDLEPLLGQVTQIIQHLYPNYDLEGLMATIFATMPNVQKVTEQGGAGDHGADLIVEYDSGLPIPVLQTSHTCVVQVKSYVGLHFDTRAVDDIRRAFERYPAADVGLIVSTAEASTSMLDAAIDKLRQDSGRRVELLIGPDVARMVMRFGKNILN